MSSNTQKYIEIKEEFNLWQKVIKSKNASNDPKLINVRTKNIVKADIQKRCTAR